MKRITFITWDEATDGIAVEHDGREVWSEISHDSWDQYFRHYMLKGEPVLLSQDTRPSEHGEEPPLASGLVRKGALAADRMSRDAEVAAACDDLARLADFGLLAGVAEIVRERLRQAETLGYTAEHDDAHEDGSLAYNSTWYVSRMRDERITGTSDPATDEGHLRKAGAMLAAEIDRLHRLVAGQVQRGERHPELGIITPDMEAGAQ